jgi:hypothetical protein
MKKSSKKIDKKNILKLIKEEADFILKKEEYYKKIKELNEELKNLYENRDFVGTFGFQGDDASKSVSGFKETPNISYVAQLEKEFAAEDARKAAKTAKEESTLNEDELNEISKLKEENKQLKTKIEEISAFISEMKKSGVTK